MNEILGTGPPKWAVSCVHRAGTPGLLSGSLARCLMSRLGEECDAGAIDVTRIHGCDPGQVYLDVPPIGRILTEQDLIVKKLVYGAA